MGQVLDHRDAGTEQEQVVDVGMCLVVGQLDAARVHAHQLHPLLDQPLQGSRRKILCLAHPAEDNVALADPAGCRSGSLDLLQGHAAFRLGPAQVEDHSVAYKLIHGDLGQVRALFEAVQGHLNVRANVVHQFDVGHDVPFALGAHLAGDLLQGVVLVDHKLAPGVRPGGFDDLGQVDDSFAHVLPFRLGYRVPLSHRRPSQRDTVSPSVPQFWAGNNLERYLVPFCSRISACSVVGLTFPQYRAILETAHKAKRSFVPPFRGDAVLYTKEE